MLSVLVNETAKKGLSGLEGFSGIPGTVGGAVISNAGTDLGWMEDVVGYVEVLQKTGKIERISRENIAFTYRGSGLEGTVVTAAGFSLKKGIKNDILKKMAALKKRRLETQPLSTLNAGSIFKNPPDNSAGRLIEACGLKGVSFGGAQVSEKHANFIVNRGKASASDVRALISLVHEKVKEKFGIGLELEIKMAGF